MPRLSNRITREKDESRSRNRTPHGGSNSISKFPAIPSMYTRSTGPSPDLVGDVHAVDGLRVSGLGNVHRGSIFRRTSVRAATWAFVRLTVPWPKTYRVIVAKPGLDGHDRGAKVVARALRDAGFEVIYTGLHQTPEQIAETAIQEDADAVGLSCHSGAHMTLFPRVVEQLRERGAGEILVFGGGIIPAEDIPKLESAGIEKIFTPGASTVDIGAWLRERLDRNASN